MDSGLRLTTTLSCGTWGNHVISENFWYNHRMNVSRISCCISDMDILSDWEIWQE